jgi:hypothetical protein
MVTAATRVIANRRCHPQCRQGDSLPDFMVLGNANSQPRNPWETRGKSGVFAGLVPINSRVAFLEVLRAAPRKGTLLVTTLFFARF